MSIPIGFSNIMDVLWDWMETGVGGEGGCKSDWGGIRVGGDNMETMSIENSTQKLSLKMIPTPLSGWV